jgi:hypothetical protein
VEERLLLTKENRLLRVGVLGAGLIARPAWLDAPCPPNLEILRILSSLLKERGTQTARELLLVDPEFSAHQRNQPRQCGLDHTVEYGRLLTSGISGARLVKITPKETDPALHTSDSQEAIEAFLLRTSG